MFCTSCGRNLKERDKFCGKCGHAIDLEDSIEAPSNKNDIEETKMDKAEASVPVEALIPKIISLPSCSGIGTPSKRGNLDVPVSSDVDKPLSSTKVSEELNDLKAKYLDKNGDEREPYKWELEAEGKSSKEIKSVIKKKKRKSREKRRVFTKDNFSYSKIFTVLGSGLFFLLTGVLLNSPKGYVVGSAVTFFGLVYLLGRVFVDLGNKGRIISALSFLIITTTAAFLIHKNLTASESSRLADLGLAWEIAPFGKSNYVSNLSVGPDDSILIAGRGEVKGDVGRLFYGKISPNGKLLWKKRRKVEGFGTLDAVAALRDGGGIFGGANGLVIRTDAQGEEVRATSIGMRDNSIMWIEDLAILGDGRIAVAGRLYIGREKNSGDNAYAALLSSEGEILWENIFASSSTGETAFSAITVTEEPALIAVGSLDHDTLNSQARIIKISLEGEKIAGLHFGAKGYETATSVYATQQGQILVGGAKQSKQGGTNMALYKMHEDWEDADVQTFSGPYTGRNELKTINQRNDGQIVLGGNANFTSGGPPYFASVFDLSSETNEIDSWQYRNGNGNGIHAMTTMSDGSQIAVISRFNTYPSSVVVRTLPGTKSYNGEIINNPD